MDMLSMALLLNLKYQYVEINQMNFVSNLTSGSKEVVLFNTSLVHYLPPQIASSIALIFFLVESLI